MICNIVQTSCLRDTIRYVMAQYEGVEDKEASIIYSNVVSDSMTDEEVYAVMEPLTNERYATTAYHMILSHHPDDDVVADDPTYIKAFIRKMEEKGIKVEDTAYFAVQHVNTDHLHYHLVMSTMDMDTRRHIKDHRIYAKASEAALEVSLEYGLHHAAEKKAERYEVREVQSGNVKERDADSLVPEMVPEHAQERKKRRDSSRGGKRSFQALGDDEMMASIYAQRDEVKGRLALAKGYTYSLRDQTGELHRQIRQAYSNRHRARQMARLASQLRWRGGTDCVIGMASRTMVAAIINPAALPELALSAAAVALMAVVEVARVPIYLVACGMEEMARLREKRFNLEVMQLKEELAEKKYEIKFHKNGVAKIEKELEKVEKFERVATGNYYEQMDGVERKIVTDARKQVRMSDFDRMVRCDKEAAEGLLMDMSLKGDSFTSYYFLEEMNKSRKPRTFSFENGWLMGQGLAQKTGKPYKYKVMEIPSAIMDFMLSNDREMSIRWNMGRSRSRDMDMEM